MREAPFPSPRASWSCQSTHCPSGAGNRPVTTATYRFSTVRSRNCSARPAAAAGDLATNTTPETGASRRLTMPTKALRPDRSASRSPRQVNRLARPAGALAVGRPAGLTAAIK